MKPRKQHHHPPPAPSAPYVPCGACRNGWIDVWETRPNYTVPIPVVKRCQCFVLHQERAKGTA